MSDILLHTKTIMDAVQALEASEKKTIVVTLEDGTLLGTITDGDIRRFSLFGGGLDEPVSLAVNKTPITALQGTQNSEVLKLARRGSVRCIPIIDAQNRFIELQDSRLLFIGANEINQKSNFAFAVVMAGGEGQRLRPYTEHMPKPMVTIADRPIIEHQIIKLRNSNIKKIFVSVNYLGDVIKDYFGDGRDFGVSITYLNEAEKLGTGGSLTLIDETPEKPILVVNGDLLTSMDYQAMYEFHNQQQAKLSVAAVNHEITVPFGVLNVSGSHIFSFEEKPKRQFFCNAGIYIIAPEIFKDSLPEAPFDMTDILENCMATPKQTTVFPVHEYWSDIGTPDDLVRARNLFQSHELGNDV